MKHSFAAVLFFLLSIKAITQEKSSSPVISAADGFIVIKGAKMQPDRSRIYKAIYDATKAPKDASQLLPALNMAGSELNALGVCGIPVNHAKFVVVFHGAAIDAILDNDHYKEKFGMDNPNLGVIAGLKKSGVQLYVCGQNLLAENIDIKKISRDVAIASDALMVLMTYQNQGYALMSF